MKMVANQNSWLSISRVLPMAQAPATSPQKGARATSRK